jgi:uncharacterized repeat protein (TIGR03803 family)
MKKRFLTLVAASTFAVALPLFAASSPKAGILYTFKGGSDGSYPLAPLVADRNGNLYGTTDLGGGSSACEEGCGTVFELVAPSLPSGKWQEKILHAFTGGADGAVPSGGLIFDSAGNLYGTTVEGGDLGNSLCANGAGNIGCGTVFELSPPQGSGSAWSEKVLHMFEEGGTDGAYPGNNLVFDKSGNLYGTTITGGRNSGCTNCGTVFELSPGTGGAWAESILYSFMDTGDGYGPTSALVFDGLGNLYGTTLSTVFQLSPASGGAWSLNTLSVIDAGDIGTARGGLLFDPSGNLFVTTTDGGAHENGEAFELIPPQAGGPWTQVTLHTFVGGSDARPYGFAEDASGNLYGTAEGNDTCGQIFKLSNSASGWNHAVLHSFSHSRFSQGCAPQATLVYGKWGALYGTTSQGGEKPCGFGSCGTVFGFLP